LLIYIHHRSSKVKITYRDPVSHQEIGSSTVEPGRMPNIQLCTLWFKIHDTAKVLVHAYWSALSPHEKFISSPHELSQTPFTILLDRPTYIAGEMLSGVIVYRPQKPKPLRSIRLQVAGYSRQISDGDFPDESKHTFFTHEAILLGTTKTGTCADISHEYYIWTFNFPLPYAIPPSGAAAGVHYYLLTREEDIQGHSEKSKKVFFGLRRVFYPRELLVPAVDAPIPVPSATPMNPANNPLEVSSVSSVADDHDDELTGVRHSVHVQNLMEEDDDSAEDGTESKPKKTKAKSGKAKSKSPRKDNSAVAASSKRDSVEGASSDEETDDSAEEHPSKSKSRKHHEESHEHDGDADSAAAKPKSEAAPHKNIPSRPKAGREPMDGPVKVSKFAAVSADGKSSIVVAAAPPPNNATIRIAARVNPALRIQPVPSSGMKHLSLPVEIENMTNKPFVSFYVSLNYIEERTFKTTSILSGSYEYTNLNRIYVKKFKFRHEQGWPLQVGQTWKGVVRLALPESAPASIDAAISPIFSRTYYAKVRAAAKGVFTKQKFSKKYLLLVGDYDYNTRPLPIQHAYNTPIRFTIFTLPCGALTPAFVSDSSAHIERTPTLVDIEQSEAVDLEASMAM
jgi:hypothetical protein